MANNDTEELVIRYLSELRKAIVSPASLSVDLFSSGVIPRKVYDDAISLDGSLTTEQKIHAICDALLKSVAIKPTLLVEFVETAVDNSPIMSDVCARIKQEALYATLEEKIIEERARMKTLREREKQYKLGEESGAGSTIEDQQLIPAPSYASNKGGPVDTPSSVKEVRKEVPFKVKRNFDILRGRYGGVFIRTFNLMKTCCLEKMKVYLFAGFKGMRSEIEAITSMDELRTFLLTKSSFIDYTIMEDLAEYLELADAQKYLSEYTTFRDQMYGKILAEDFAVAAIDEDIKDHKTKIVFVVEWIEDQVTLLEFEKMLRHVFQNACRFINLIAVHHSLLTFICVAPTWTVSSLILVAKDSIDILRNLGVVKLTIGQEVILDDQSRKVTELDVPEKAESSPKVVEVTEEASESLQTFQQFFYRLTYTIRRPDLLAQDLCEHGIIDQSIELQVTTHKGERLARAHLLLNAVESKIAGSKEREGLMEFCHALMRDLHLRFLGQEMALQANIAQVESFSDALPDHLRVFEKYYLTICTTIEYPGILAKQLLHDELITEDDNLQISEEPFEKAAFLLDAVERKIAEGGWEIFRTFLCAMIRHRELQSLAEEIIQTEHLTQVVPVASSGDHTTHLIPVDFVFSGFSVHKLSNKEWFSPPFYSHKNGYRFKLNVYPNGNNQGWGSHLSTSVHLAAGEHDEKLNWPFIGSVTLQLRDRTGKQHIEWAASFSGDDLQVCGRVTDSEISENGCGDPTFIPLSELMKKNVYLQDDELVFRIVSAIAYSPKLTSKVLSQVLPTTHKYVHVFELTDYSLHKHQEDRYLSPPFYTHHGGYKLGFAIDCNGAGEGKVTHLSVTAHLMSGENDDDLKWPFHGQITLQLVNEAGDHSHVTHVFDFGKVPKICNERVTVGDSALYGPWIPRFIDHITLSKIISSPSSHAVKYVSDDRIHFRVVSVVFPNY